MSEEMAVNEQSSSEDAKMNGNAALPGSVVDSTESGAPPATEPSEGNQETSADQPVDNVESEEATARKRRASSAFTDPEENEDFRGFDQSNLDDSTANYSRVLERMEEEVSAVSEALTPVRSIIATPNARGRVSKRLRQDTGTDVSRPSSALSSRSDGDGVASSNDRGRIPMVELTSIVVMPKLTSSAASSPAHHKGRRPTTEMSSPLLRVPLDKGWKRELVFRAALDAYSRRNADIYYYTPAGKKLRSTREVAEHLSGTGLTIENFSFFKEPLGVDDPEKEIIRDAKLIRRLESPPVSAPVVESKRARQKSVKATTPEPPAKTKSPPPALIKVKSVGSRLSQNTPPAAKTKKQQQQQQATTPTTTPTTPVVDNNNSGSWKKPSEPKRGRVSNGVSTPTTTTPRRRGRAKAADSDHFTEAYHKGKESNFNIAVQIFQYLGMRELAWCGRVCRLWRQLVADPPLWRHVRMKNSHVSDWAGLCTSLKKHETKTLDLRKMLLPQNDTPFWESFAQNIGKVDTLERIEMCRCPASAIEAVSNSLPKLQSLSALAVRENSLNPQPLSKLSQLRTLRLKSMSGLSLTSDLKPLAKLTRLTSLSLTSIKELGMCACEVIGSLKQLESLELGECTFRASFGAVLSNLHKLQRLRLERGTAECAAPALLRALATLPKLTQLELVNFDVKVGFDDALAECKNVQRLLIIPTYVSQSATTNKQVLSGVLKLSGSLTHLMWGVTIELLRVTELFIDQCDQGGESKKKDIGECIPVLKPVPGCRLPDDATPLSAPPQVEILPLPTLQRLLSAQLPNTKLKLLRIPFHATWRQSLADFQ